MKMAQRSISATACSGQASLSPQWGEGLRVRGGSSRGTSLETEVADTITPHPGPLPVEGRERTACCLGKDFVRFGSTPAYCRFVTGRPQCRRGDPEISNNFASAQASPASDKLAARWASS